MRPGYLNLCLLSLYFLIASAASPRDKYRDPNDHLTDVDAADLGDEPTCDQLRAMWVFSKRQSRAAERTNEIPTYKDPFAYNIWEDHPSNRRVGGGKIRRPYVYGRIVHNVQRPRIQNLPELELLFGAPEYIPKDYNRRNPTYVRLVGGKEASNKMHLNRPQTGSFQHLKELVQSERLRELHEQKVAEEIAARKSALPLLFRDDNMWTGLVPDGGEPDNLNFKTDRRRREPKGMINFPGYTNLNYRLYPDILSTD